MMFGSGFVEKAAYSGFFLPAEESETDDQSTGAVAALVCQAYSRPALFVALVSLHLRPVVQEKNLLNPSIHFCIHS